MNRIEDLPDVTTEEAIKVYLIQAYKSAFDRCDTFDTTTIDGAYKQGMVDGEAKIIGYLTKHFFQDVHYGRDEYFKTVINS